MRKPYEEFQLLIERASERFYRATVVLCPAGIVATSRFRLDLESLGGEKLRQLLLAVPPGEDRAKEIGRELFTKVFDREVRTSFRSSLQHCESRGSALRIQLHFAKVPELVCLPWEYLYDDDRQDFVALSQTTPLVRLLDTPNPVTHSSAPEPLRILVVVSSPEDLVALDAGKELQQIRDALAIPIRERRVVVEALAQATVQSLRHRLRRDRPQVLHFIGHGAFHGHGELVFENKEGLSHPVKDAWLRTYLRGCGLRLVVLNVCQGGAGSSTDSHAGLAQSLALADVPAVVAMQHPIEDRVAITFAKRFYEELAIGGTLEDALTEARLALSSLGEGNAWANPVLYMRSQGGALVGPSAAWKRARARILFQAWKLAKSGQDHWHRFHRATAWSFVVLTLVVGTGWRIERWARQSAVRTQAPLNRDIGCDSLKVMGMKFARIPAGARPFCMGAYEVTQGQWRTVTGSNPSVFPGDELPVEWVNWEDVENFLVVLNKNLVGAKCRLPSKHEWNDGAQLGAAARYSFGDDFSRAREFTNCGNWSSQPIKVGSFPPNQLGLYDMDGNVSEWVESPELDSKHHRIQGGSWSLVATSCAFDRGSEVLASRHRADVGFRLLCEPI